MPGTSLQPELEETSASTLSEIKPKVEVKVQVKFVTNIEKFKLPETVVFLPVTLKRQGLSEIVNHLLGLQDAAVPFDFLIQSEFLKTSLASFMNRRELSTESVLEIEYIESTLPPTPLAAYKHDDWISSVNISNNGLILTGSYDNKVRVWDQASNCLAILAHHRAPVLDVEWVSQESGVQILSCSQDQTISAWKNTADSGYQHMFYARGHTKPVLAVRAAPNLRQFASSSADSTIKLWTMASLEEDPESTILGSQLASTDAPNKKLKSGKEDILYKGAQITLEGHFGSVPCLTYDHNDSTKLFSGGYDHAMRGWDLLTGTNVMTKTCDKSFIALAHASAPNLLASGHTDSLLRVWDPRVQESAVMKLSLTGHTNWISSVQFEDNSHHRLISASYDGSVKVWDLRSRTPQFTMRHNNSTPQSSFDPRTVSATHSTFSSKLLTVAARGSLLCSGGQDTKLKLHKLPAEN